MAGMSISNVHAVQGASEGREPSFAPYESAKPDCETDSAFRFAGDIKDRIGAALQLLLDEGGDRLGKKRLAADLGIHVRSLEYYLARDVKPSAEIVLALLNILSKRGHPDIAAGFYGYDNEGEIERRVADRLYDKVAGLLAGLNARRPELRTVDGGKR